MGGDIVWGRMDGDRVPVGGIGKEVGCNETTKYGKEWIFGKICGKICDERKICTRTSPILLCCVVFCFVLLCCVLFCSPFSVLFCRVLLCFVLSCPVVFSCTLRNLKVVGGKCVGYGSVVGMEVVRGMVYVEVWEGWMSVTLDDGV
jgi:hypothetical protein